MSPDTLSVANVLMLAPSKGREAWREWRAGIDLDRLDGDCLAVLPLLAGRLRQWLPGEDEGDPAREIILGICKRGWALNQLRYREAAGAIDTLRRTGLEPAALFGPVAWALLYEEEEAVRPIETLDILVHRDQVKRASAALLAAGWLLEPGMPAPEGRALDQFAALWWKSPSRTPLQLAWRLARVPPELAQSRESAPGSRPIQLLGTQAIVLQTEELLLDALTRERDQLVNWQCDAAVLLRNRSVDWQRLQLLLRDSPAAAGRLRQIQRQAGVAIPPAVLEARAPGWIVRRLSRIQADYRWICWDAERRESLAGFAAYAGKRLLARIKAGAS